jgi:hypothetical protein
MKERGGHRRELEKDVITLMSHEDHHGSQGDKPQEWPRKNKKREN